MSRRRAGSLGLACLWILAIAGCGTQNPSALAMVNGRAMTKKDWQTALAATKVATGVSLPKTPSAERAQVSALAAQQAVIDYALSHHLATLATARREAVSYIAKTVSPRYHGHLAPVLTANHLTQAAFSHYLTDQMVLKETFDRVTHHVSPVSQAAIARYYATHASQFTLPTTLEVRHILVKSRTLAQALLRQIRQGASFAALAERYSKDLSSARAGGSLGYVERGKASGLLPSFYKVMDSLKPGHFGIAHTRLGYHIIEVQAVKPGSEAALAKVRPVIAAELMRTDKASKFDAWAARIQRAAKVKIFNA
ncbi:MAG: peptidylprolyl isomerase [Thermaerobacter sp.]|nr:peptidylprolyl isomerase [Thermaerobacter sp.]